jgi:STE24 endopeptidase
MTHFPATSLDQDRQAKARRYARLKRRFWLLQLMLSGLYLLAWSLAGIGLLSEWMASPGSPFNRTAWPIDLLGAALIVMGPYWIATLPLDFHTSYRLPHRFGLSTQTIRGWVMDQIKMLLIGGALGIPLLLGLYALIRTQAQWWLLAGLAYSMVTVLLATLAPILLMPLFYTLKPLKQDRPDLVERLKNLAKRNGASIEGVYSIDMSRRTRAANAALTGLFGTRRVLLGDTMLENFEDDQIEAVLAHELAHHVHHDIPLSILIQTALNLVAFWLGAVVLQSFAFPLGLTGSGDPAGLPLLALAFGLSGLLTMPLSNAYSRWRERLADDFALDNIEQPQSFASAMTRLTDQNLAEADPDRWVVLLLYSHPPLAHRIARANHARASK